MPKTSDLKRTATGGQARAPLATTSLPTRQIHLDFHTSEHIPDIGERFSKEQWQEALQAGHVNGINIFAKGHHGWSYYPTEVGQMHPHLDFDLLGAQIEACHEIGVECPDLLHGRLVGERCGDAPGVVRATPGWLVCLARRPRCRTR